MMKTDMEKCSYKTMYLINKYEREILESCRDTKKDNKTNILPEKDVHEINGENNINYSDHTENNESNHSIPTNSKIRNNTTVDESIVQSTSTPIIKKSVPSEIKKI